MAGKETYGIEAATADLFRGRTYCLIPSKKASSQSVDKVIRMVRRLGAEPLFIGAEEHDDLAAGISHLPPGSRYDQESFLASNVQTGGLRLSRPHSPGLGKP